MPGSSPVADILRGLVTKAMRESVVEIDRAGHGRGTLHLIVALDFGDHGEVVGADSALYFQNRMRHRPARERHGETR